MSSHLQSAVSLSSYSESSAEIWTTSSGTETVYGLGATASKAVYAVGKLVVDRIELTAARLRFGALQRLPLNREAAAVRGLSGKLLRDLYEDLLEFSICPLDQGKLCDQALGILWAGIDDLEIEDDFLAEAIYHWSDVKIEILTSEVLRRYGECRILPLEEMDPALRFFELLGRLLGPDVGSSLKKFYSQVKEGTPFLNGWDPDVYRSAVKGRPPKVLVLGSGGSGKSMLIKEMKVQHGYAPNELAGFRSVIYRNVWDSVHSVMQVMHRLNIRPTCVRNQIWTEIDQYVNATDAVLTAEVAEAIHALMQDETITKIMKEEFELTEVSYFLNEVLRIGSQGYLPTADDVLRAQSSSRGIWDTRLKTERLTFDMFELRRPCFEDREWIRQFKSTIFIIFCVPLGDYDEPSLPVVEDKKYRLDESVDIFKSVVNSRWFLRTSIILLFTKADIFKEKISRIPLKTYLPMYTGGSDYIKAIKYIWRIFLQVNKQKLPIFS